MSKPNQVFFLFEKKKVSLWRVEPNSESFEPTILAESEDLDGRVTELKVKRKLFNYYNLLMTILIKY